jgi:D-alanyl-D-alanine carboxypeptidase
MGARRRALAFVAILAVAAVGSALYVAGHSDTIATASGRRTGIRVAGNAVAGLGLFQDELLVWAFGGFSDREVALVARSQRVEAISAVRTGLLGAARGGRAGVVPVEAIAVDRQAYGAAVGRAGARLGAMLGRGVVLSATGARLRGLDEGDRLRLTGGVALQVAGVVDDRLLGGYEALLPLELGERLHLDHPDYLLLRPRGSRSGLEANLRRLLPGRALRFRVYGQRPFLRAGDAVLPLAQVKARFGEFTVPSLRRVEPDPTWVAANIVTQQVPLLGQVRCHRLVIPDLAAAMAELQRRGLARLVDVADFHREGGCYVPRQLRGGEGQLSRHSWGIAVDLNVAANPLGQPPQQDPRLVQVMARHGFTWGGRWLRPDGGHFEWVGRGA